MGEIVSDEKKIYIDTGVLRHLDPEILKYLLEKFRKQEKLVPEKPLWVLQQENKKLWRK